jgi:hypothetical protein
MFRARTTYRRSPRHSPVRHRAEANANTDWTVETDFDGIRWSAG